VLVLGAMSIFIQPPRWLFKTWHHEKVAQVIDGLPAEGKKVVLTSSPDKQELIMIDTILAKTKECAN